MNNKALSMLSIAAKAGKVSSGAFMSEKSIQQQLACLVIIAADASKNTLKKFTDKCKYYEIPYVVMSDGETLGRLIGKQSRMVLTINDESLANQITARCDSKDMEV